MDTDTAPILPTSEIEFTIREAHLEDAPLIAALTRAAWADKVTAMSSGHRESPEWVLDELSQGGGFILYVNDKAIGSVRYIPVEGVNHTWEMRRMGVHPHYRGRALSQHLLEAVVHHAQASGIEELRLGVRPSQEKLIDLYTAYAFELAPELEFSNHSHIHEPPPLVMRRYL